MKLVNELRPMCPPFLKIVLYACGPDLWAKSVHRGRVDFPSKSLSLGMVDFLPGRELIMFAYREMAVVVRFENW